MEQEFANDTQYGFPELFDSIGAEDDAEKIQAEIGIYRRVEDSMNENIKSALSGDPALMRGTGNTSASLYADYAEALEESSELEEGFYELDVEERLESIENNPEVLKYLNRSRSG